MNISPKYHRALLDIADGKAPRGAGISMTVLRQTGLAHNDLGTGWQLTQAGHEALAALDKQTKR